MSKHSIILSGLYRYNKGYKGNSNNENSNKENEDNASAIFHLLNWTLNCVMGLLKMFSQLEKQAVTIRRSISDQRTQKRSQRGKGGRKTKQNKTLWPFFMAVVQGVSLLFITKSSGVLSTHLINLRRIKRWVDLGATQRIWIQDP